MPIGSSRTADGLSPGEVFTEAIREHDPGEAARERARRREDRDSGQQHQGTLVVGTLPSTTRHRASTSCSGPAAAHVLAHLSEDDVDPDYSRIFVTYPAVDVRHAGHIIQTDVRLDEVINGLASDDVRLRDAGLALSAV